MGPPGTVTLEIEAPRHDLESALEQTETQAPVQSVEPRFSDPGPPGSRLLEADRLE